MMAKFTVQGQAGPGERLESYDVPANQVAIILGIEAANLPVLAAKIKRDLPVVQGVFADGKVEGMMEYISLMSVLADLAGAK